MNKIKLICMVGISSSGKSTIAKELAKNYNAVIVSSDTIREEICGRVEDQTQNGKVFQIFHQRIRTYLADGKNVIADATNITMKSRRAILENIKHIDCEKIAYIVPKKIEDCIKDNVDREHPVPEYIIRQQAMRFEIPFKEEGFDDIEIHAFSGNKGDKNYFVELFEKMKNFDQKNPHHTETLGYHCVTVMNALCDKGYFDSITLAALFHDLGKMYTQTFDEDGIAHYYSHHNISSHLILSHIADFYALYEFSVDENSGEFTQESFLNMLFIVNYHMFPFFWKEEKTHNKYKKIFGEIKYKQLMDFNECDKIRP